MIKSCREVAAQAAAAVRRTSLCYSCVTRASSVWIMFDLPSTDVRLQNVVPHA
jgi:hypothetical protein